MAKRVSVLGVVLAVVLATHNLLLAWVPSVQSGQWAAIQPDPEEAAATMLQARDGAAAVLLSNDRVLIIGGAAADGTALSTAEVFTPQGQFLQAAPMNVARKGHTATLLPNGRVLVAGGVTTTGEATASVEIYDAATDTWTPAGALQAARSGHTATLGSGDQVVIVGGENSGAPVGTLEAYDGANGIVIAAGPTGTARMNHAAAKLGDGRVVIFGGSDGNATLATTEVFDPATFAIGAGPAMPQARKNAAAVTLPDGTVFIVGGHDGTADMGAALRFDGTSFTSAGSLSMARQRPVAVLLPNNNSVLVFGGTLDGGAAGSAELYRPWSNDMVTTGLPGALRATPAASPLALDGLLLSAGGNGTTGAELYGFATVTTGNANYLADETAAVSGAGWQALEEVTLVLRDGAATKASFTTVSNDIGQISVSFVVPASTAGARLTLTAYGGVSQAQTGFGISEPLPASDEPPVGPPAGPSVWTSKSDYVPSESVDMNGSGWAPGETVTLALTESPQEHASRTFEVVADEFGNFLYDGFRPEPHHAGVFFTLKAVGTSSGLQAQTTFMDSVGVGASNSASNAGNGAGSRELVISVPAVAVGDVVIAQIAIVDAIAGGGPAFTPNVFICPTTAGWTSILKNNREDKILQETFWFRATAAAAATSHTWQFRTTSCAGGLIPTGQKWASGGVTIFTGVTGTGSPVDVSAGNAGSSSGPFTAPSVTTTTANSRILRYFGVFKNTAITHASATRFYNALSSNMKERSVAGFDGGNQAAAGATGTFTATLGSSAEFVSQTIALKEGVVGPTKLAFTTPARSGNVHACLSAITVQTQNASDAATNVTADAAVTLASDDPSGAFFSDSSCTTALTLANRTIPTGSNSFTFYYKATQVGDGSHQLTASASGLTSAMQTETITAIPVILTGTRTFDGTTTAAFGILSVSNAGAEDVVTVDSGSATLASADVGAQAITDLGTLTLDGANAGNYTLTGATGSVTITQAAVTATAGSGSGTYNGATQSPSACVVTGAYTGDLACTNDPTSVGPNVGTFPISPSVTGTGLGNFDVTEVDGSYEITQAPSTVTVTCTVGAPYTYTGFAQTPCTAEATGVGMSPVDVTASLVYANNINVGAATADAAWAGDTNHTGNTGSGGFSIGQATLSVTASSPTVTYADPVPAITPIYGTFLGTDNAGVIDSAPTCTTAYTPASGAGSNPATSCSGGSDNNYAFSFVAGSVIVNKAPTATVITCPASVTYTGFPIEPCTAAVTGAGGLNTTTTVTYTNNLLVGTATANATYLESANHLGSMAVEKTFVITTGFCFNGFLAPVGGSVETSNGGSWADPVRAFKLGSTIPIKFVLTSVASGCGTVVTTGIHTLTAQKMSSSTDGDPAINATPTDAATTGNQFRLTGDEWHFNLSTRSGFSQGTWLLTATLQDGSKQTVWISIKK